MSGTFEDMIAHINGQARLIEQWKIIAQEAILQIPAGPARDEFTKKHGIFLPPDVSDQLVGGPQQPTSPPGSAAGPIIGEPVQKGTVESADAPQAKPERDSEPKADKPSPTPLNRN